MTLAIDTSVSEAPSFLTDIVLELSDKLVHAVNDRKLEAAEREVRSITSQLNGTTTRRERSDAQRRLSSAIRQRDFIARTMP